MRTESILLSLIHLFSLIFFIAVGCFALFSAISLPLRGQLGSVLIYAETLLEPKVLGILGACFLAYGLLLLILLLMGFRKVYLRVALKGSKVMIDHSIIQEYIQSYFKTLFPGQNPPLEVIFHPKQRLEILTKLPETADKELLLKRIENELGVLLARKLGYKEEFILTFHEA
ncbi:MAG: hypothetical protein ACOYK9_02355 [Chlamydiia bacterium]